MLDTIIGHSRKSVTAPSPLESYSRTYSTRIDFDDYFVETVDSLSALPTYLSVWKRLAKDCLVQNPFYEPYFLIPNLQKLHKSGQVKFVFIFQKNKSDQLVGVFPLEKGSNGFLSLSRWRLLIDDLTLRSVPLLANSNPEQTLAVFLKWAGQAGLGLLEFDRIPAEGPFQHALTHAFRVTNTNPYIVGQTTNAILDRKMLETNENPRVARELRRKRRRLEDLGEVQFLMLEDHEAHTQWRHDFLRLEASGWKGRSGTALAKSDQERELFLTTTQQAWDRGKLQMCGLFLEGKPLALKCNLLSGRESLGWKIAYDETYSKYSPGLLLEIDHQRYFLQQDRIDRYDFCTSSCNPLCQRVSHQQWAMQRLLIPCQSLVSDCYCGIVPLLRRLKRYAERCR